MTKAIQFTVDVTTDDDYDLSHKDLKAIRNTFDSLFPNDNIVVYYDDGVEGDRYHVWAEYKEFDHMSESYEIHNVSKIILLPKKFTMETVIEFLGLQDNSTVIVKSLSKL